MVKKLKKMAEQKAASPIGMLDSQLASAVKASAQQIWLAGMGAFSKAQAEGGKVFEALVKEGTHLQRKTQAVAEERLGEVTGKMSAMAGEVTSKAGASWDKLESIFESRTAKAMAKLGVPTAQDVAALTARIDALAAAVTQLTGQRAGAAAPRPATKKRVAAAPAKTTTPPRQPAKAPKAAVKAAAKPAAQAAAKAAAKPAAQPAAKPARPRAAAKKVAAKS